MTDRLPDRIAERIAERITDQGAVQITSQIFDVHQEFGSIQRFYPYNAITLPALLR